MLLRHKGSIFHGHAIQYRLLTTRSSMIKERLRITQRNLETWAKYNYRNHIWDQDQLKLLLYLEGPNLWAMFLLAPPYPTFRVE